MYNRIHTITSLHPHPPSTQKKPHVHGLLRHLETDSDNESDGEDAIDPKHPWKAEYQRYIDTVEAVPTDMDIVEWWGVRD